MNLQILFATGNAGKIREIEDILTDPGVKVASIKDAGIESEPEENGWTFEANAIIKAKAVADLLRFPGTPRWARERQALMERQDEMSREELNRRLDAIGILPVKLPQMNPQARLVIMADDSGLVIDALNGEPGIHSARYLGRETPYPEKMNHILTLMKDVPEEKRTAHFVAAVAAVLPDGSSFTVRGEIEGLIAHEIRGTNGFGYDPIFYIPELGKTSGELPEYEKNQISHRGRASRLMMQKLGEIYEGTNHQ